VGARVDFTFNHIGNEAAQNRCKLETIATFVSNVPPILYTVEDSWAIVGLNRRDYSREGVNNAQKTSFHTRHYPTPVLDLE
jgi:hypothetical protein